MNELAHALAERVTGDWAEIVRVIGCERGPEWADELPDDLVIGWTEVGPRP